MRRLCAAALAALTAFSPVPSLAAAVRVPEIPILRDIALNPPGAVIIDYDGTATDRGADGLSLPPPQPLIDRVTRLLEAGLPVGIATGRNLDLQPSGPQMMVWEPLISRIPAPLRANLFFSGRMGAEFVLFDAAGLPVRVLEGDWTPSERAGIDAGIAAAFDGARVRPEEAKVIHVPGQSNVAFPLGDPRAAEFARLLTEDFGRRGLPFPVQHNKNWVYLGKADKGDGMRLIYAALRARGYKIEPAGLLYIGDEFRKRPGRPAGGDTAAALAFPAMRAVSVGGEADEELPANVTAFPLSGSQGTMAVLDAVLEGLAPRPAVRAAPGRPLVFAVGAAAGLALPWLWAHPSVAAAASSITLTFLAVPQIVKNFRLRAAATKDLALGYPLIWFPVALLLSGVSLLNHSSGWYAGSNVVAAAQSLVLMAQINAFSPSPENRRRTLRALAATLVPAVLLFGLLPAGLAMKAAFAAAMALLLVIDIPQIRKNHLLYRAEGRAPAGVSALHPALIWAGSLLGLLAGAALGDWFWALNSVNALVMISINLGQLFSPRWTNALLRPFFRHGPKPGTQAS